MHTMGHIYVPLPISVKVAFTVWATFISDE